MFPANPFVVAEISANHRGSLERAIALIDACAAAGAHAVKFQAYQAESMVIDQSYTLHEGPWKGRRLIDLYREGETPFDWFPTLFAHANSKGIVPFASVFDAGGLAMLERLGCQYYKIASFELVDARLIETVAKTGKPLLLSTGMASMLEILGAVRTVQVSGHIDALTLLHCVSAYPTPIDQADLRRIHMLQANFGVPVGLSDHTTGVTAAICATAMGARVIEKHVTLDRSQGGLDADFSLEPDELRDLVFAVDAAARATSSSYSPHSARLSAERSSAPLRRSLWVTEPIAKGHIITHKHVGSYRPGIGFPCHFLRRVIGSRATRDLRAGEPLSAEMFER